MSVIFESVLTFDFACEPLLSCDFETTTSPKLGEKFATALAMGKNRSSAHWLVHGAQMSKSGCVFLHSIDHSFIRGDLHGVSKPSGMRTHKVVA